MTHIKAAVFFLDALDVKVPYRVIAVGHRHPLVVCDHVIVYRLDRLRVRLHPTDLEHQSSDRGLNRRAGDGERRGVDGVGAGNRGDGVADFAEDAAISSQASDCGIQTDVGDACPEVCMHARTYVRAHTD